jgi:nitrogen fixation protein FixH
MVAGLLVMARIAVEDPGFAVEKDYYKKAVGYDAEMAQQARNATLGFIAQADAPAVSDKAPPSIEVTLRDRDGQPVAGRELHAEVFQNARAAELLALHGRETTPGKYLLTLPAAHPGVWIVRATFQHESERFTADLRVSLGSPEGRKTAP